MVKSRVEYATDQITIYRYCPYACEYCYVWRNKIFSSRVIRGKYNPLEEAKRYLNKEGRTIVISFVSDPYPPEEKERQITREVLSILAKSRNRVMILTKNPILALRDIEIIQQGDIWLGTTVITLENWQKYEPRVPSPFDRLHALRVAKKQGIKTWLSIEPLVPQKNPETIIEISASFVDLYVLGSLNYRLLGFKKEELRRFYREHIPRMTKLIEELGRPYIIKKELKRYLGEK